MERINHLYYVNNQRIQFDFSSEQFTHHNQELKQSLEGMKKQLEIELEDTNLLLSAKKRLKSLNNHWSGLIVFVEHPEIPMDNNIAEN